MEFIRFGSSVPGEYWGCCACDIIQNFNQHPNTPASIQLTSGDGNGACLKGRELAFAGPTLKDIFETRIRIGTFGLTDMPNHAFFAILEASQLSKRAPGYEWLKILKANGFEFLRTVDNSVYTGDTLDDGNEKGVPHPNYIFALFRNIGRGRVDDPFTPPKQWSDLPSVVPEVWETIEEGCGQGAKPELAALLTQKQKEIWKKGKTIIRPESDIIAAGAPVIMAGMRTERPPELKKKREEALAERKKKAFAYTPTNGIQYIYEQEDECDEPGESW